jgi:hypothetical protein
MDEMDVWHNASQGLSLSKTRFDQLGPCKLPSAVVTLSFIS